MTLIDVNILLYAYNAKAPQQAACASWLERTLEGPDLIGLSLPVVWGFLRIGTNPRVWPNPMSTAQAFGIVKELFAFPGVVPVQPGARHLEILEALVTKYGVAGPLMSDAVLAALAIENGAVLASTDRDFSRFDNLRWINPLS